MNRCEKQIIDKSDYDREKKERRTVQEKQNTDIHFEGEGGAAPRAKPVSINRIIKATKGIITQYVKGRVA